jgi:hypothetical protein
LESQIKWLKETVQWLKDDNEKIDSNIGMLTGAKTTSSRNKVKN